MSVILLKDVNEFYLTDSVCVIDFRGHAYVGLFNGFKLRNQHSYMNKYDLTITVALTVSHISLRNCHIQPANSTLSKFKKTRYKYKMIDWVVEISPARTVLFEKVKKQVRLKQSEFLGYDFSY